MLSALFFFIVSNNKIASAITSVNSCSLCPNFGYVGQNYGSCPLFGAVDPEGNPFTYVLTGLPAGMAFNAATGKLSGTSTAPGSYAIEVKAIDQWGSQSSPGNFLFKVNYCGDGVVNGPEVCDGNSDSCTIGGASGLKNCKNNCTWDTCSLACSAGVSGCAGKTCNVDSDSCTPSSLCTGGGCVAACTAGFTGCNPGKVCSVDSDTCTPSSVCVFGSGCTVCGNGILNPGEDCDFGVANNGKGHGCDSACKKEAGVTFCAGGPFAANQKCCYSSFVVAAKGVVDLITGAPSNGAVMNFYAGDFATAWCIPHPPNVKDTRPAMCNFNPADNGSVYKDQCITVNGECTLANPLPAGNYILTGPTNVNMTSVSVPFFFCTDYLGNLV